MQVTILVSQLPNSTNIAATGMLVGSSGVHGLQDCNPHPYPQTPLPMTLDGSPNPCPSPVVVQLGTSHTWC